MQGCGRIVCSVCTGAVCPSVSPPFFISSRVKFCMPGAAASQLPSATQPLRARIMARMALVLNGSDCMPWIHVSPTSEVSTGRLAFARVSSGRKSSNVAVRTCARGSDRKECYLSPRNVI